MLLRSDGAAVAAGDSACGQCEVPAPGPNLFYTNVAAGAYHTVLLRSDGTAVACGADVRGQCAA